MNEIYRNAIANAGAALITYIGIIDELGQELSGGEYARQPVTWNTATGGVIRPTDNLIFLIPPGVTIAGWRGYSAISGGTNYGGGALSSQTFTGGGQLTLIAANMGILHLGEI